MLIPNTVISFETTGIFKSFRNSEVCNRVCVLKQAKRSHIGSKCLMGESVGLYVCVLGSRVLGKQSTMCISAVAVEMMRSYFLTSYQLVRISSSCENIHAEEQTHTHCKQTYKHTFKTSTPSPLILSRNPYQHHTHTHTHPGTTKKTKLERSLSISDTSKLHKSHIQKPIEMKTHTPTHKGAKTFAYTKTKRKNTRAHIFLLFLAISLPH